MASDLEESNPKKESTKLLSSKEKNVVRQADRKSKISCFNSTRYIILVISLLCCTTVFSNSLSLNFTIICMTSSDSEDGGNSSITSESSETKYNEIYSFSSGQKAWLFSAVAVGTFIGALPLTVLTSKIGIRIIFTVYGLISAFSTFFLPFAASFGYTFLFLSRILQGFGASALFAATGSIVNEWATIAESGLFLACLSCHHQLAEIFLMPVAGYFCGSSKFGWKGIYYLQGILTFVIFVLFFVFYRNFPKKHANVGIKELSKIDEGKENTTTSHRQSQIPYRKIITDKSVIGVWIASLGGFTGFQLFLQYGPTFLNKVLKLNVEKTGIVGAIPFIGALCVKLISGPLSDRLTCISQKRRCKIFGSISQFSMAFCITALGYMPIKSELFAQIAFTAAIMFSSLNVVGVIKCAQLQSRQYAHFVMNVITFINSGIILFLPLLVSTLAPNNAYHEWALIFYTVAILVTITTIIFILTCEADPRPWTLDETLNSDKLNGPKERLLLLNS